MTPPKNAFFEKLEIHLFVKIFRLRVKIRNFWVPKNSPYVTYTPYEYELERMKTHEMRAK